LAVRGFGVKDEIKSSSDFTMIPREKSTNAVESPARSEDSDVASPPFPGIGNESGHHDTMSLSIRLTDRRISWVMLKGGFIA
jgi:hypothetical protein